MQSRTHAIGLVLAALAPFFSPHLLAAQIVQVRSVPVATGNQFLLGPSSNIALGGVSIALDDPLLDPFVNPAKGARIEGSDVFVAPTFYGVADDGAGRTLPIGILAGSPRWFGAASLAVQQIDSDGAPGFVGNGSLDDRSNINMYASGTLGTKLGDGRTSVALGVSYAELRAVDGVELLYAGSRRIDQDGYNADFRVGLLHETPGRRTFEALLLHDRFDVSHDVEYREWVWDEEFQQGEVVQRVEHNVDRTNTWGVHLGYAQPLAGGDWRIGGILTGNYKSHPKIPNYDIMNIPRDPGVSWAYNLGVGLARTEGPAVFAVDIIFEPIRSDTWADAAEATESVGGRIIGVGERTVENEFRFTNARIRLGAGREIGRAGLRLGLEMHTIGYDLEQHDHIEEVRRIRDERWVEWTPSWGLDLRFPEVTFRYAGSTTLGTGRPGIAQDGWGDVRVASFATASNFIVAPQDDLTLDDARVLTHQFSVSIPLGRREPVVVTRGGAEER